jgi:hypothetical protein
MSGFELETVKAGKQKRDSEHVLSMDGQARVIFTPEDGKIEEFKVGAVIPLQGSSAHKSPMGTGFFIGMNMPRKMEWYVFVTDVRVVFWSPQVVGLSGFLSASGDVKVTPGKATACHLFYPDFSAISYGVSDFERCRVALHFAEGIKVTTSPTAKGKMAISAIQNLRTYGCDQYVYAIEADGAVLSGIAYAIAIRANANAAVDDFWRNAAQTLTKVDYENDSGKIILNPMLDERAPIDKWFLEAAPSLGNNGQNSVEATENSSVLCRNCGTPITIDGKFCIKCGTPVQSAEG